jgi:aspartate ammonia-lyase
MPGKVNPVIPEVVNQMCFQIIGDDAVILMAAEASELELNRTEPIIEGLAAKVGDIDMHAGCEGGLRG